MDPQWEWVYVKVFAGYVWGFVAARSGDNNFCEMCESAMNPSACQDLIEALLNTQILQSICCFVLWFTLLHCPPLTSSPLFSCLGLFDIGRNGSRCVLLMRFSCMWQNVYSFFWGCVFFDLVLMSEKINGWFCAPVSALLNVTRRTALVFLWCSE